MVSYRVVDWKGEKGLRGKGGLLVWLPLPHDLRSGEEIGEPCRSKAMKATLKVCRKSGAVERRKQPNDICFLISLRMRLSG